MKQFRKWQIENYTSNTIPAILSWDKSKHMMAQLHRDQYQLLGL